MSEPSGSHGPTVGTETDRRWCPKCGHDVVPVGKGRCPVHQIFLTANSAARKHPVNVRRRDARLAELLAEFPPANSVERRHRELLATIEERLDTQRSGSAEWLRLSTVASTLEAGLLDGQRRVQSTATVQFTLEDIERELEANAALLEDVRRMRARESGGRVAAESPDPAAETPDPAAPTAVGLTFSTDPNPDYPPLAAHGLGDSDEFAPDSGDPQCPYGCGPMSRCRTLREEHPDSWRVIHWPDPDEVKRRDREATDVMMRNPGHPR